MRLLDYISSLEEGVKLDPVLVEAVRLEGARYVLNLRLPTSVKKCVRI